MRLVDVLFDICVSRFYSEGWKIQKILRPPANNDNLAQVDDENVKVIMYPHDPTKHPPLEQTFLHELLHIGFDLGAEWDVKLLNKEYPERKKRGATYWLERYLWRRLTATQKALLTQMLAD